MLIPPGTGREARVVLAARGLRAFGDGYMSLLLPYYLTRLGHDPFEVGAIVTATLLGSGAMTLGLGLHAHRWEARALLFGACILMAITGVAFAGVESYAALLVVAVLGTVNPSNGDVSVFQPLEQSLLARAATPAGRTALFARYSLVGALVAALGAQAAAIPGLLALHAGTTELQALRAMFVLYGLIGVACLALYRHLPARQARAPGEQPSALGPSRARVYRMAALFSVDAFAGGFAVQSLLALWLYQRYGLTIVVTGTIFFWAGILTAVSQLLAAPLAQRIGLINTMVYTHLPSNVFLLLVPFMPTATLAVTFLLLRSLLSSMDVPARVSYVMAVVRPEERAAAASITNVPRSLASAISPAIAGWLLGLSAFGWPLVICGSLKIGYDLALLVLFRKVKPPEEL